MTLCAAIKGETVADQFPEPFAVTGDCATPLTVTITDALAALVPVIVVAPAQSGAVIDGAAVTDCTVTLLDGALTHCPVTCAVAVMLCPAVNGETVVDQFPEPFAVTAVCGVPFIVTITDALFALVPVIVVAPTQIGAVIDGAAVTDCTVTLADDALTHCPDTCAVAVTV